MWSLWKIVDLPGVQCLYIRVFIKRHKHLGFALTSEIQNKHISKQSDSWLLFPFCTIIVSCFCLKTQMKTGGNNQSELWRKHLIVCCCSWLEIRMKEGKSVRGACDEAFRCGIYPSRSIHHVSFFSEVFTTFQKQNRGIICDFPEISLRYVIMSWI